MEGGCFGAWQITIPKQWFLQLLCFDFLGSHAIEESYSLQFKSPKSGKKHEIA